MRIVLITTMKLEIIPKVGQRVVLDITPESLEWSNKASYSELNVLTTDNPDVRYLYSSSKLTITGIRLYNSDSNIVHINRIIEQGTECKLTHGSLVLPNCYLTTFSYSETQWRGGKVYEAKGSLEVVIARVVKPTPKTPVKKPTARERAKR